MKGGFVEEVIYVCVRDLDGRILDCKLAMHANFFDENMTHDLSSMHNGMRNKSDVTSFDVITVLKICVFRQLVHGGS